MNRFEELAIAFDQCLNTIFGSGWADETLSAWLWRTHKTLAIHLIDGLFFWQHQHCRTAYESEVLRKQLPIEYRSVSLESGS